MVKLEPIVQFLDGLLGTEGFPDYPGAANGLQVERRGGVARVLAAVDASELTIREAVRRQADLLLVHHGLFWGGAAPLTGRRYRKLAPLFENDLAVYSSHLPLDAHPELGNSAILARTLGVSVEAAFGSFEGRKIGWWGTLDQDREALRVGAARAVGGNGEEKAEGVRLIPGGPEQVRKVAVVTGGGSSFIEEAARLGMDALVTGEGPHHSYFDAMELGVNVYFAGHYATETFGVRALADRVAKEFGVEAGFIDMPTGL